MSYKQYSAAEVRRLAIIANRDIAQAKNEGLVFTDEYQRAHNIASKFNNEYFKYGKKFLENMSDAEKQAYQNRLSEIVNDYENKSNWQKWIKKREKFENRGFAPALIARAEQNYKTVHGLFYKFSEENDNTRTGLNLTAEIYGKELDYKNREKLIRFLAEVDLKSELDDEQMNFINSIINRNKISKRDVIEYQQKPIDERIKWGD